MSRRIIVTGAAGLVGHRLVRRLREQGHDVVEIDLLPHAGAGLDYSSPEALALCDGSIDGIIHLAAISRVAWGEQDPELCKAINVAGMQRLLAHMRAAAPEAWFLFASSREVYGEARQDLVREHDPLAPVNVYGRSKLGGEKLVDQARAAGCATATVRLCNVYGGRQDHPDRAVPSLAWRTVTEQTLHLTGGDAYFDFVHVDDVVDGLIRAMHLLATGETRLPTVHLATGEATSLRALANLTLQIAGGGSTIVEHAARDFDVSGFCGAPELAEKVLGWKAGVTLERGLAMVIADLRANGALPPVELADIQSAARQASTVET